MGLVEFVGDQSINLAASIAILLLGLVFGRFISKLLQKILHELDVNLLVKKVFNTRFPLEQLTGSFVKYVIYITAVVLALNQLGLVQVILYGLLLLILTILVVFVLIAIKDFVPNLLAGVSILKNEVVKVGDNIIVDGIKGKVVQVTLVETELKSKEGDIIWVPNNFLVKHVVRKK